jgi:hypothetical protein
LSGGLVARLAGTRRSPCTPDRDSGAGQHGSAHATRRISFVEECGTIDNGADVSIHVEFGAKTTPAEGQEIVDSVLATIRWS